MSSSAKHKYSQTSSCSAKRRSLSHFIPLLTELQTVNPVWCLMKTFNSPRLSGCYALEQEWVMSTNKLLACTKIYSRKSEPSSVCSSLGNQSKEKNIASIFTTSEVVILHVTCTNNQDLEQRMWRDGLVFLGDLANMAHCTAIKSF